MLRVHPRQDTGGGDAAVKDDGLYLRHMLERCERISRFIQAGKGRFLQSEALQDAVSRDIALIREAAEQVAPT